MYTQGNIFGNVWKWEMLLASYKSDDPYGERYVRIIISEMWKLNKKRERIKNIKLERSNGGLNW